LDRGRNGRQRRWQLALAGIAVAATFLSAALISTRPSRPAGTPNLPTPREQWMDLGPHAAWDPWEFVEEQWMDLGPHAVWEPWEFVIEPAAKPVIASSLPENVFGDYPRTPNPPRRPTVPWQWKGTLYVLEAEQSVLDAADACTLPWREYRRAEADLRDLRAAGVNDGVKDLEERLRKQSEATRPRYLELLEALRAHVDKVDKLYRQHVDDPEVRAAVERRNAVVGGGRSLHKAGHSPEFQAIVKRLKIHEDWAGQIGYRRPQIKGKSPNAPVGEFPPDF
jgi:hypothetical protein